MEPAALLVFATLIAFDSVQAYDCEVVAFSQLPPPLPAAAKAAIGSSSTLNCTLTPSVASCAVLAAHSASPGAAYQHGGELCCLLPRLRPRALLGPRRFRRHHRPTHEESSLQSTAAWLNLTASQAAPQLLFGASLLGQPSCESGEPEPEAEVEEVRLPGLGDSADPPPPLPSRECGLERLSFKLLPASSARGLPLIGTARSVALESCALACFRLTLCTHASFDGGDPEGQPCQLLSSWLAKNPAHSSGALPPLPSHLAALPRAEATEGALLMGNITCAGGADSTSPEFLKDLFRFLRWMFKPSRKAGDPLGKVGSGSWSESGWIEGSSEAEEVGWAGDCGVPAVPPKSLHSVRSAPFSWRVVGGSEARPHSWPWQASLLYYGGHSCGATLIDDRHLLTAAHWDNVVGIPGVARNLNPAVYKVVLGSHHRRWREPDQLRLAVRQIALHSRFHKPKYHSNDVALVRLAEPVNSTRTVRPVCLAKVPLPPDTLCVVTGWGSLKVQRRRGFRRRAAGAERLFLVGPVVRLVRRWIAALTPAPAPATPAAAHSRIAREGGLRQVSVPLVRQDVCGDAAHYGAALDQGMLCAGWGQGGRDSCQGDSGGPLVCPDAAWPGRWALAGVVSWGTGCGLPKRPGVYASVPHYLPWIRAMIAKP